MKSKITITLLSLVIMALLGVVGYGAYYVNKTDGGLSSIMGELTPSGDNISNSIANLARGDDSSHKIGFIREIDELIMNLDISKKSTGNYLRVKINFELRDDDDENYFEEFEAVIFDKILSICSSKTKEELMSIGGKDDLKEDLKSNINRNLPSNIIKNVYFREFVIQ